MKRTLLTISQYVFTWALILCFYFVGKLFAQDIHFSQFYASPLTLNPASTGLIPGDLRLTANYRNQKTNSFLPYNTYSFAIEGKIFNNKLGNDHVGIGILAIKDKSGNGINFNIDEIMLSGAYHNELGADNYLTLGFQGGFGQRSVSNNDAIFPDQWDEDRGIDPGIGRELITYRNVNYFDFQMGLLWYKFFDENMSSGFAGISIYHVTKPDLGFLSDNSRLNRRYLFHGGTRIMFNEQRGIIPNIIYMYQGKAQLLTLGFAFENNFGSERHAISLGAYYRIGDAIIPTLSFDYEGLHIGLSYDIGISGLKKVNKNIGAFELSLIYDFSFSLSKNVIQLPCPEI